MKRISYIIAFFIGISGAMAQETPLKLSLQDAVDYAIKNKYDNKVARKSIIAAKERKWETIATGLPQINGSVSYQYWLKQQFMFLDGAIAGQPGTTVSFPAGTKQSTTASATLTQLLFDGSYLVGLQSAKTYLKISEQAKTKTELTTREAVINAYGNVLVNEELIQVLERNKANLQKNIDETQKIYENGLTEQENVEQLQITLGTINNTLRNAKRMQLISYQMLNIALGNKTNQSLKLTDSLEQLSQKNTDLALLGKKFNINNHIDYQMALNDREAKELLIKLEKSKALPSLSAFVNYGASINSNEESFFYFDDKWINSSLLGINLNIPIFSSFSRRAKTRQAKIELEQADIKLEQLEQSLTLQAEASKSEYQLSIENLDTAKKNLALAERIENKNQVKFKEGLASSFDLRQAQMQLYTEQNNYIQAMLDVISKKTKLETALNTPIK